MLVPPPPGDGAGSLASGAGSSAAAATDAADAAGLAGEEDPVPDPPTGDLYRSRYNPNAESFAALQIEMTSPGFQEELEKARDNPKSKEAGKLIQRLKRFITMSGVKIPSPECDAFNEADLNLPHLGLA